MSIPNPPAPVILMDAPSVVIGIRRIRRQARQDKDYDTTGVLLPDAGRRQYVSTFTPLAQKIGHPIGIRQSLLRRGIADHNILRGTGKSGLTPIDAPPLYVPRSRRRQTLAERRNTITQRNLRNYQRMRFWLFTARELYNMESLACLDNGAYSDSLNNPIYKIFARGNWLTEARLPKHQASVPVYGDVQGFWDATNPAVWNILEPCCRIVTKILISPSALSWLDTVISGTRQDAFTHPERGLIRRIIPRRVQLSPYDIFNVINRISNDIMICITTGYTLLKTLLPEGKHPHQGCTLAQRLLGPTSALISLSLEALQPLLRNDLTDAERLQYTHRAAAIMLHEFGHAVWTALGQPPREPFYDFEVLTELGWSFEDKLWGGTMEDVVGIDFYNGGAGLPSMGLFKNNFFNDKHGGAYNYFDHGRPSIDYYRFDNYPVPVSWSLSQFKPDFWNAVNRFGGNLLHMQPLTFGTRLLSNVQYPQIGDFHTIMTDQVAAMYDANHIFTPLVITNSLPDDEKTRLLLEAERRSQTWRIFLRVRGQALRTDPIPRGPRGELYYDGSESEDEIAAVAYTSPRFDEIRDYMFRNRGPLQLALDTMTFLSEPCFYRYIRDRGGISLTPHEFRNFLGVCNSRSELFFYDSFPGAGMVYRTSIGWPPGIPLSNYTMPPLTQPFNDSWLDPVSYRGIQVPCTFANQEMAKTSVYGRCGEANDIDFGDYWDILRLILPGALQCPKDRMRDVFIELTRRGSDQMRHFTLGPEGILRILWNDPDMLQRARDKHASDFTKQRIIYYQHREAITIARLAGRRQP